MTAWCEAIFHRYEAVESQLPGIGWHFFAVAAIAVPFVLMTLLSFSLLLARKALRTS